MRVPGTPRSAPPVRGHRPAPLTGRTSTLRLVLPGERPISWNTLYASPHHQVRTRLTHAAHDAIAARLLELGVEPVPFIVPVDLSFVVYFDHRGRRMDCSNLPAKLYEDGLVKFGLLLDDTPKWVRMVTLRSRYDKTDPRVELTLTPSALPED